MNIILDVNGGHFYAIPHMSKKYLNYKLLLPIHLKVTATAKNWDPPVAVPDNFEEQTKTVADDFEEAKAESNPDNLEEAKQIYCRKLNQ